MLARLRDMLEDPLLGKVGRSMMPTPRATAFHLPLPHPMIDVANMIRPAEFDPREASAVIGIAAIDAAIEPVVASWIRGPAAHSPGLRLEIGAVALETPEALSRGDVDFAVDVYPDPVEGFHVSHLYFDRFVCVLRKHHPAARSRLTRRVYSRLHHLQVTGTGGGGNILEMELARLGSSRKIAVWMPSLATAPFTASQTDWALTAPSTRARLSAKFFAIAVGPLPFPVRALPLSPLSHERTDASPLHQWMRARLIRPCAAAAESFQSERALDVVLHVSDRTDRVSGERTPVPRVGIHRSECRSMGQHAPHRRIGQPKPGFGRRGGYRRRALGRAQCNDSSRQGGFLSASAAHNFGRSGKLRQSDLFGSRAGANAQLQGAEMADHVAQPPCGPRNHDLRSGERLSRTADQPGKAQQGASPRGDDRVGRRYLETPREHLQVHMREQAMDRDESALAIRQHGDPVHNDVGRRDVVLRARDMRAIK